MKLERVRENPRARAALIERIIDRFEAGAITQTALAKEIGVHPSVVSRWYTKANMAKKKKKKKTRQEAAAPNRRGPKSRFSEEQQLAAIERAKIVGRRQVSAELGLSHSVISSWASRLKARGVVTESSPTMVSSRSSRRASPALPPFLSGLEEVIATIVEQRVEDALRRLLKTKSLWELSR